MRMTKRQHKNPIPFYEIKATDVSRSLIHAFGGTWQTSGFIGRILPQDVGKRVYKVGPGVLQVENDAQFRRRTVKRRNAPMEWNTEDVTAELVKHFGADAREEIAETLDLDKGRYSDWGTAGSVTIDGTEYNLIADEDEAERIALDLVKQDLDEQPEMFSQDWLSSHIEISETDKRVMASEEEDHIREQVEEEAKHKRFDFDTDEEREEWIEDEVDKLRNEFEKSLDDSIQYFVHDQGIYSVEDLMKQPWIRIDIDEAAQSAVDTDGWAHFLSTYDGNYDTTPGGLVFFQEG